MVRFSGAALSTSFVNDHQLTSTVPAGNILNAETASITVANPGPGIVNSNVVFLPVAMPETSASFLNAAGSPIQLGINAGVVAVADFNGDGKQDLAIAHFFNQGTVDILLSNGDGTFTPAAGSPIPIGNEVDWLAVGDFNGDGKPDLALVEKSVNTVAVLLGNGDGTFTPAPGSPNVVGANPQQVSLCDFNGDGKLDLAVTNAFGNSVSILLGNGDGTFTQPAGTPVPVGNSPEGIAAGDFNGDGILDLAIANSRDFTITILLGNGDGTFASAPGSPVAAGKLPDYVVAADFNGDGKLDLATSNSNSGTVSILLGNGDGTFSQANGSPVQAGSIPEAILAGDFNGDGKLDLAVLDGANSVKILLGNGDGTFAPFTTTAVSNPDYMTVGDFNGDGRLDLIVVDGFDNKLFVLLQP